MTGSIQFAVIIACLLLGVFFTFVSAVGVLRLPDVYARAHTASQVDTLGAGFALAGVAVAMGVTPKTVGAILLLVFMFVTNPTAAHAIARAAHESGISPWHADDDRDDTELAAEATSGGEQS